MAMTRTQALQQQWQSKNPDKFRVRLFKHEIHMSDLVKSHQHDIFWQVAEKFKETKQAKWVEDNEIELKWMEDDNVAIWHKLCLIYADLTESQYLDYSLRFFQHTEEWK